MKKLLLLTTIMLSTIYAHECKYTLEIDLDIEKGLLKGHAIIESDHPSMKLLDTKANIMSVKNAKLTVNENVPYLIKEDVNRALEMTFTHNFQPISSDAILLESWYPKIDIMCKYETIVSNSEITTVIEATKVTHDGTSKHYIFENPLESLHLIASKNYVVSSKTTKDGLTLSTSLYPYDVHLSNIYLQRSEKYFNLYNNIFGFLPFKNFSVVETPFPAGYSMPTYTLIGKQIISKDFVLDSSLGHEIAHQWFGGYVYSPDQGNWVEGITTFYSDYLYAKQKSKASDYRKDILMKYNSFVNQNNETALIEFTHKNKESNNAIGYGKATFFFYMLEKKIGEDAFNRGVKKLFQMYPYKTASYKNLREIFEEVSGLKLLDFFITWVYNKGALDIKIDNINLIFLKDKYILEFDTVANMQLTSVPISVCSNEECLYTTIDITKKRQRLELDIEPTKIVIDETYEVFRKLDEREVPPVISKIIQDNTLVVIDKDDEKKFSKIIFAYKSFKYADEITFEEIKNNNILIFGAKNSLLEKFAINFKMEGEGKIEVFKNPLNTSNVIAVFDVEQISNTFLYKLKHLGKYSTVVIKGGVIVEKTTKESLNGIIYTINSGSFAQKPNKQKLGDTFKDIVDKKVVFIGEMHTEFSSHLNQLKIIKAMYKNNPKLSIGMEMFQKPFQKFLDAFIAGTISEKEMLKKTEYFKRWKYDYELYRPIVLFAKDKHIPIIALNIDRAITKIVVSEGLDALSDEQRSEVPTSIDFSNEKYKQQLKSIYSMHQSQNFKSFEEFYHAQLLWDESMAMNIVKYMKKNKDYNMAVLAGNGHVMYGYGIPSRMKRRGIVDYAITLNMRSHEPGIADYILSASPVGTQKAKKLGVYLESNETLNVIKIVENSFAAKADIKAGDTIISFNGVLLKDKFDLQRELAFLKGSGDILLLRDSKEINVTIEFSN
ncbi:ChaN family lipoprotein [Candidatus Sulfurimonas marisnigri]|uniref:ChaN family lipoprotein n=1 Tax=Candidatus Sulfurimonas marisnigri TaxID=2740405 RepID=A0A7S7LYG0_9BACT|nr:ChaN family lipoprotein [Candidatus Sulfurimonas marisnigri]QOY53747.1 ChaN family lipoprotein [Candidatus Sulfurimonas marisnigri]